MNTEIPFIDYSELLKQLEDSSNNHLLLGNGFNNLFGIKTDYESIFLKMLKEEPVYEKIKKEIQKESINYDIERLIDELRKCLKPENENIGEFLNIYIQQKVKFDFMKAASSIVQEQVKKIYQERSYDIYVLFKNFDNYFTLNYDTFLYLLLMKFKNPDDDQNSVVAFSNTSRFQQEDLNDRQNNIYEEIKNARKDGKLEIIIGNEPAKIDLKSVTKGDFETNIRQYSKKENKGWVRKDIKSVCGRIWEEENNNKKLDHINDGFQKDIFEEDNISQNIFFLHGSFHIYRDKQLVKKITRQDNKAFYQHFDEIIWENEKEIVCVLTDTSENKVDEIGDNRYLKKCLDQLSKLSGNIVIFGSSLSDNDKHIFESINQSSVKKIYISSCKKQKKEHSKRSERLFPEKEIVLFDYETISYGLKD